MSQECLSPNCKSHNKTICCIYCDQIEECKRRNRVCRWISFYYECPSYIKDESED